MSWILTEVALESGPRGAGFHGIALAMQPRHEQIADRYFALRSSGPGPVLDELEGFLREIPDIQGKLSAARFLSDSAKLVEHGQQLQKDCLELLRRACASFNIPIAPPHIRSASFKGAQAVVVSDLVGYTPRALALIPAGMHLGDDGVVNFVLQLNERIKLQLKGAFEELHRADLWEEHLVALMGDGGAVRFTNVADALAYARALHRQAENFNATSNPTVPYQHRIGIAWGMIMLNVETNCDVHTVVQVGIPFLQANRMEGAVAPEGIAIEQGAWARLEEELRAKGQPLPPDFTEHRDLTGKPGEPPYHGWVCGGVARPH